MHNHRFLFAKWPLLAMAILIISFAAPGLPQTGTSASLTNKTFLPSLSRTPSGASRLGVWIADNVDQVPPLAATGAGWTRVELSWSSVEPVLTTPATYDWRAYDGLLAALGQTNLNVIVEIRGNPGWAAHTACGPVDIRPDRYGDFLRALVSRYGAYPFNVKHWEIYNEPENRIPVPWGDLLGGCFGDNPGGYANTLRAAYAAIKQADSSAKVVFGGLALGQATDRATGQLIFNTDFLNQVLAQNVGAYFDVANIHYYSSQMGAWSAYGGDIAGKLNFVRQTLAGYGLSKPVMITELSWTSSAVGAADFQEMQARYVAKALSRGVSLDIYAMTWFTLRDWPGTDYPYGLIDQNGNQRLAYRAFQTAAAEFGQATAARPIAAADLGGVTGVEGYAFDLSAPQRWVLWCEGSSRQVTLPIQASEVRDKLGQTIATRNGGTPITVTIGDSPVYVHLSP